MENLDGNANGHAGLVADDAGGDRDHSFRTRVLSLVGTSIDAIETARQILAYSNKQEAEDAGRVLLEAQGQLRLFQEEAGMDGEGERGREAPHGPAAEDAPVVPEG